LNSFSQQSSYLATSESVTEGHPDKLCDQISDAILDAILEKDPMAHVACEVSVAMGIVTIMGEISRTCGVLVSVKEQSPDIAAGVSCSLEARDDKQSEEILDKMGAGDQGMMSGFACKETPELMPLPIVLAHRLCYRLAQVRKEGIIPYTIDYNHGLPKKATCVILGAQHDPGVEHSRIEHDLMEEVVNKVMPSDLMDGTIFLVNTAGQFEIGGPVSDTGFTGRKIIVDTYGSASRHGGGCFSGKDPTKVDRSAAYMARYAAKNLVAAGLADYLEIQVAYAIGKASPLSLTVETFGTGKISGEAMLDLIGKHFDFRPEAIIRTLNLRRPIYRQTAAYGHFGRCDLDLPWEKTDKADILKAEAKF